MPLCQDWMIYSSCTIYMNQKYTADFVNVRQHYDIISDCLLLYRPIIPLCTLDFVYTDDIRRTFLKMYLTILSLTIIVTINIVTLNLGILGISDGWYWCLNTKRFMLTTHSVSRQFMLYSRVVILRHPVKGSPWYPCWHRHTALWLMTSHSAKGPQAPGHGSRHFSLMQARLLGHSLCSTHSGRQLGGTPT